MLLKTVAVTTSDGVTIASTTNDDVLISRKITIDNKKIDLNKIPINKKVIIASRCYSCADQRRREKLDMRDVRLNQIFMTNQLEDIKKKVQTVRKVRQNNRRQFGTFKVNATWSKEAIEDLKKLQSYDSVQEMELKLISEMQSLNKFYIRNFFNI